MKPMAYLYVKKGPPFHPGDCIELCKDEMIIGRSSKDTKPDLSFFNQYVSRHHVSIQFQDEKAFIMDLGSKHGTEVGTVKLVPYSPYLLKNSDVIRLANGAVILHFAYSFAEQTLDLNLSLPLSQSEQVLEPFTIDLKRRSCSIFDRQISLTEKEWALLRLLYERFNTFVSNEEIIKHVWPERITNNNGIPDVGLGEINSLIYRVRRKLKDVVHIENVRGKGYLFNYKHIGQNPADDH